MPVDFRARVALVSRVMASPALMLTNVAKALTIVVLRLSVRIQLVRSRVRVKADTVERASSVVILTSVIKISTIACQMQHVQIRMEVTPMHMILVSLAMDLRVVLIFAHCVTMRQLAKMALVSVHLLILDRELIAKEMT